MDDASQLLAMLSHVYSAQSTSQNIPAATAKIVSPVRVSASHCSAFEQLLVATRDVGKELVQVLSSKIAVERVLDQLPFGLLVVTDDLHVLSANRFARALVEGASGLIIVKRRLACMDGRSHQRLELRMRRLLSLPRGEGVCSALRVARAKDVPDLQLNIVPLEVLQGTATTVDVPSCCIWVFDPASQRQLPVELLRDLHGLTAAEAEVAVALYRGLAIDDVALELGVSGNTVKTHLKRVFQKCEVRSQAELLQMLALGPR